MKAEQRHMQFLREAYDWLFWEREMNEPDGWGPTAEHAEIVWELWDA